MKTYESYSRLKKPFFAPPSWLFGPVWSFLYILIAVSYAYVVYLSVLGNIPTVVLLPFLLNLIFNFAFTPLQFGFRSLWLASVDVVLVLATLIWALIAVYPYTHWVAWVNLPYLLWVCFATVLQLTVLLLNKGKQP